MNAMLSENFDNLKDHVPADKWAATLADLLQLAKKASENFQYERALGYLATMEELWQSKALPNFSDELKFDLYNEKGRVLSKLGRYGEAVTESEKLLKFCQDKKMPAKRAEVFLEIGQLLAKQGELDRALGHLHRALGLYRRLNDPQGICKSLRNLGVIYIEMGEFDDAESSYKEAIQIALVNDQYILYADLNNNLGAIRNMKGDWEGALESYHLAKEVYEREREVRKAAYTVNNIGITFLEQEQYGRALKYFVAAVRTAESIKDASLCLILSINLTDLYLKRGEIDEAKRYCSNAETYLATEKLRNSQLVETRKLAGQIAMREGNFNEALRCFDEAFEISDELGLQYQQAEVWHEKGRLYLEMDSHMEALQSLERAIHIFSQLQAAGRIEKTENLIGSIEELYLKIFESMAHKVDQKDHYTKGHSDRVAHLALVIARELNLTDGEVKEVVGGALLHDIGKLDIADEIIKKEGKLTDDEYAEIKSHPDRGVQRLSGMTFPWNIEPLIRYHHERFDGGGYPAGLSGELIPLGARIICVCDVFDALTSERPYRAAFPAERALQVMKTEMAVAFDPVILDTLINLVHAGRLEEILNRQTSPDELYRIWAGVRVKENSDADEAVPDPAVTVAR
ncbi:hypothetical protein TRIP_C20434 [Candidatus Zixiibacteriota bacterium]|nr:hypothetical protein TRIP_C20434 [candidate division Zixibacteria bacterium]